MPDAQTLTSDFTSYAESKLAENLAQIERCLALLTGEQVWQRPNDVSNAIGNLVLHLAGNVRQWIVSGLGGEPFARDRQSEFDQRESIPTGEIAKTLSDAVIGAVRVLSSLTPEDLARTVTIQGYQTTGLSAVFHVVEHFSLHTGQIVYQTKILTAQDLSLYDEQGHRLDGRSTSVP